MEGTGSPERDRVDEQLGLARRVIAAVDQNPDGAIPLSVADRIAVAGMQVQLHCAEALVRQIRDLDDDVWATKQAILEANSDLITTLNGGLDVRSSGQQESKRGLFN